MNLHPTVKKKKEKKKRHLHAHSAKLERSLSNSIVFNNHIERTHFDKINIARLLEINNDY